MIVALLAAWSLLRRDGRMVSNGPLSSNHANLENNCAACHSGFAPVSNEACSTCHEKHGDELGVYTFASHYLYRSDDFQRVVPSPDEEPCIACHTEHQGRTAEITRVADARCQACHEFSPFSDHHPEFAFAQATEPDSNPGDRALAFAHIQHVKELIIRQSLDASNPDEVERTCLACHNPEPAGRSFQPIDFDRHCDACHLAATDRTPPLPVAGESPGVQTLQAIQLAGLPGSRWADYVNPGEFRQQGERIVKSPLYHRDPWVLHNLRRLRQQLLGDGGLADLLTASPDVRPAELRSLYEEAIATLEAQALDLRSIPDRAVQRELEQIDTVLAALKRRLEDPHAPLDETGFLLALTPPADPESADAERIRTVAEALTEPCRNCHTVEDATIVRVENDLGTLKRAEFNHRAHMLQRGCLDCHTEIPFAEFLNSDGAVVPAELDRAEIQNLPKIAVCGECHNENLASQTCVTCHLFHPDTDRRSELIQFVNPETANAG